MDWSHAYETLCILDFYRCRHVPAEHGPSEVEGSSKPLASPLKIKIKRKNAVRSHIKSLPDLPTSIPGTQEVLIPLVITQLDIIFQLIHSETAKANIFKLESMNRKKQVDGCAKWSKHSCVFQVFEVTGSVCACQPMRKGWIAYYRYYLDLHGPRALDTRPLPIENFLVCWRCVWSSSNGFVWV